ncbi:hypothetical protein [Arthrobacter sp. B3I4]|uniref:hypothetical protein n=1 Tax=Arthrobacter sp. B3I4 TaxID=3042267 RepID=UPI00278A405A|nr:hypothetical protein [Arthrobacter sp. B3I4]MDQ0756643.1 cob(I)alamin adenosyltransferase [Arthrobacter sp. B3I4]
MSGRARPGRRVTAVLLLSSLPLAIAGCASTGITRSLSTPVGDARSAVNASLVVLGQESAGRTTKAALKVTLKDELDQINSAYAKAAALSANSRDDVRIQQDMLALLQDTATTVLSVQQGADASDADSLQRSAEKLQGQAKALDAAVQSLKAAS